METWANVSNSSGEFDKIIEETVSNSLPPWAGYIFMFGASLCWSVMYFPIKQYDIGDTFFFQLILVKGLWSTGFILNALRQFPVFHPLPLIGGILMGTGNLLSTFAVKFVGMGLSYTLWSITSLIVSWVTVRFGLLGLKPDVPSNVIYNYIGVALAVASTVLFMFVKTDVNKKANSENEDTNVSTSPDTNKSQELMEEYEDIFEKIDKLSGKMKRIVGTVLALICGAIFGEAFTPILLVTQQNGSSKNYLDYLFSYFSGILFTSLCYFVIYCGLKRNKPVIYPGIVLPGLLSGLLWGFADVFYFLGTAALSPVLTYPIANTVPQMLTNLWGILVFKEIRGAKNFAFLLAGFCVTITAAVLVGLSY